MRKVVAVEFAKVFVDPETHTIAWPGGIDLCPDTLYEECGRLLGEITLLAHQGRPPLLDIPATEP